MTFGIFDIPQGDPEPILLASSPWPMIIILAVYLLFVLKLGKIYMRNRKPYDLKRLLMFYNLGQVVYNGIYFGVVFYYLFIEGICNLRCMESFPPGHKHRQLERVVHTAYLVNKVVDLLDTVFFVLRKSYKQVSFLHIYHHVFMAFGGYVVTRIYGTGGHFNSVGLLNTFVHTVMYFYYFLSSEYPAVKGNIWWKKYITLTQIVQFVLLFSYSFYVRFLSPNCAVPNSLLYVNMFQGIVFMYLFGKFYIQAYVRPPSVQSQSESQSQLQSQYQPQSQPQSMQKQKLS